MLNYDIVEICCIRKKAGTIFLFVFVHQHSCERHCVQFSVIFPHARTLPLRSFVTI